jgi:ABC-type transport system involved in cytochrome c biogenesis permease subunit
MLDRAPANPLKTLVAPLASLRLTVVLLALALVLIYAGTWAQIDNGIWQVQREYFHSFFYWLDPALFFPRNADGTLKSIRLFTVGGNAVFAKVPMPGGYLLGLLLLINLLAAHALRFKATWKDLVLIPALAASFAIAYAYPPQNNLSLVIVLALAPLPILAAVAPLHKKRTGVILIHLGLIVLLVGEGITSGFAQESQMRVEEGSYANYAEDIRTTELAIVDPSAPDRDSVIAIPESKLATGAVIKHAAMPFEVRVDDYFANSNILGPMQAGNRANAKATAGQGVGITAVAEPAATGEAINLPSAYVTLTRDGQSLGTYLVSNLIDQFRKPFLPPQEVKVGDKTFLIQLRFKRLYKPYTIHLIDFRFDRYLGTDVAKNFSSDVRLVDPTRNVDRNVRIWMNNPLRYAGETFFQADWNKQTERGTVLQIVKNPAWSMPYLACAIGAVGLVAHFGITLINFIRKRAAMTQATPEAISGAGAGAGAGAESRSRRGKAQRGTSDRTPTAGPPPRIPPVPVTPSTPWFSPATLSALLFVFVVFCFTLIYTFRPVGPRSAFDLKTFATLPVSHEGRVQPLDSLARNSLKVISGRETAVTADKDGTKLSAVHWLADIFGRPDVAAAYPVIRIDNKDVLGLLDLDASRKRFSLNEVLGPAPASREPGAPVSTNRQKLQEQLERATAARRADPKSLDLFQRKILELGDKLNVYIGLGQMESLFLIPPLAPGEQWQPLSKAMRVADGQPNPTAKTYLTLVGALHEQKPDTFNSEIAAYAKQIEEKLPRPHKKVRFEAFFNRADPFTQCIALYLTAFVLTCLSWLSGGVPLRRAATVAILASVFIHTAGLVGRMYITERPPVISNLASTAFFIAWGGVLLATGIELIFRNGIGAVAAGMMGFTSLLIGDRLALQGDTMKVLQAVLDTNFWLATHVIIITLGYSATFVAGILAIIYLVGGVFTPALDKDASKELTRMIYGVTCFAILFSFVGTVLGGIWADQSWGRFWGWDPKENGAVMIVLANALLLHARWGGLVGGRGIACLAIFGNIITAWSWFGTNMLGVGLHSYGFMDRALTWLLAFVISQLLLIIAATMIPWRWVR